MLLVYCIIFFLAVLFVVVSVCCFVVRGLVVCGLLFLVGWCLLFVNLCLLSCFVGFDYCSPASRDVSRGTTSTMRANQFTVLSANSRLCFLAIVDV